MFYSTDISEIVTDHEHKVTMKNGVLFLIMRHYASDVLASQPPPPLSGPTLPFDKRHMMISTSVYLVMVLMLQNSGFIKEYNFLDRF